jgi:hypothetical protein
VKSFKNKLRVKCCLAPLEGKTGTVVRMRMADNGAWVSMDEALPASLVSFPADDDRHHHVLLYPEDCEEI